jgi:hypothetical protein
VKLVSITKNSNIFGWFYGNTMLSNSKNLELMVLLVMVISEISITKISNISGWFYGNTMLSNSKNLELMVLFVTRNDGAPIQL